MMRQLYLRTLPAHASSGCPAQFLCYSMLGASRTASSIMSAIASASTSLKYCFTAARASRVSCTLYPSTSAWEHKTDIAIGHFKTAIEPTQQANKCRETNLDQ